jgi:hypothetical protein
MDPGIVIPEMIGIGLAYAVIPAAVIGASAALQPQRVTCPENGEAAAVRLDFKRAALSLFADGRHRVRGCSRWPARAGGDRACERTLGV